MFLKGLLERILGIEPKLVMYSDSSSCKERTRESPTLRRYLLWIQKIKGLVIKAITGKDNPADLGTKSLSRDKIRKYMVAIGYIGDYLDQEVQEDAEVRRISQGRLRFDEAKISRSIQAVTTSVLISLCEASRRNHGEGRRRR